MTKTQRQEALSELDSINQRAQALADKLDPQRTFTARDEVTRVVISACDVISSKAGHASAMIRVST